MHFLGKLLPDSAVTLQRLCVIRVRLWCNARLGAASVLDHFVGNVLVIWKLCKDCLTLAIMHLQICALVPDHADLPLPITTPAFSKFYLPVLPAMCCVAEVHKTFRIQDNVARTSSQSRLLLVF